MFYVFFSVICSVTVSVILKMARQYQVDTTQMIVWNYPLAALLTLFLLDPSFAGFSVAQLPWIVYIGLAILLPGIFVAISSSIRYTGIVRTEVAQRLSLIIPLVAAFWLFNETPQVGKLLGVAIGLGAILCSIGWHKGRNQYGTNHKMWSFPLIVFLGMGVIDILFKTIAQHTGVPYTTSMFFVFVLAMLVAITYLVYVVFSRKKMFSVHAIFWGIALGLFNFGNILFYMKAHRAMPENPSIVFTGMNIGVILLGAVVGTAFFDEKLTKLNKIGLGLAVLAVLIIAFL